MAKKKARKKAAKRGSKKTNTKVSPAQFAVLEAIVNNDGSITASVLATTLKIKAPAASKRLSGLRINKFLSNGGSRGTHTLTAKGRRAFDSFNSQSGKGTTARNNRSGNTPSVKFTSRNGVGTITISDIPQSQINQIVQSHIEEGIGSFFSQVINQD